MALVFKGMGQAMRVIEGFTGGSNRSNYSRIPFYSPVAFQRFRLVFPVFRAVGVPQADVIFSGAQGNVRYQAGYEYPYTTASTGIAVRPAITFGGLNYGVYDSTTWGTTSGLMISDIMDVGSVVPARTAFGIWSAVELSAAGTNAVPYSWTLNNTPVQRYCTTVYSAGPIIAASGSATDVALVLTSITPVASPSTCITPIAMLIEVDEATECVVICGDSKAKGVNEGSTGSGAFGDVWGDTYGNKGIVERGIWDNYPGYLSVNIAQGSDGNKYQYLPGAFKYRLQMMALARPTKVVNAYAHNDQASATCPIWTVSTAYIKGDSSRVASAGVYACIQAGTSKSTGTGPSGTGQNIVDGTCRWAWLSNDQTAEGQTMQAQYARMIEVNRLIRNNVPAAKLYGFCAEPSSIYTGGTGGANPADQTPGSGFGSLTGRRSLWNARVRAKDPLLGITGFIDTNPYLEYDLANQSGKWDNQAVANRLSIDGVHENSYGYSLAGQGVIFTASGLPSFPTGTRVTMIGDSIVSDAYHESFVAFQSRVWGEMSWAGVGGDTLPWRHFAYKNLGNAWTTDDVIGGSLGIGGETSNGLRYGSTIIQAQHLQAAINMDPGIVIVAIGTNGGTTDATSAVVIANTQAIVRRLIDEGGHHVILANIRPRDDNHAVWDARMNQINAWHASYTDPSVTKWYPNAALSTDGVGYFDPTWTRDGVHPTPRGAQISGCGGNADNSSLSYVLRSLMPDANWFDDNLTATANKHPNGRLTGSGGTAGLNVTGTVPNNMTVLGVGGTGVTCVCSVEANAETGGQNLIMDFTSTGLGSGPEEFRAGAANLSVAATGWASTDFIHKWDHILVDDSVNQIIKGTENYLQGDAGRVYRGLGRFGNTDVSYPKTVYKGWLQTDPMAVGAATTFTHRVAVFVDGTTAGTARVKILGEMIKSVGSAGDAALLFPYDGSNPLLGQNVTPTLTATGVLSPLVVIPPPPGVIPTGNLIYQNSFSSPTSFSTVPELQALNTPTSGAAKPAGIPNRLMVNTGVMTAYLEDSDPETFLGQRSEAKFSNDSLADDMWYTFEVRADKADWTQIGLEEVSLFQVHALDTIVGTTILMIATLNNGQLKLRFPVPDPPINPVTSASENGYPMPFDRWIRVAVHGFWKNDINGVIEVYFDGAPLIRRYNRGSCYNADGPYLKLGLYNTTHVAGFGFRRAYYRNLKIYRGTSSYATVLGGRPTTPHALIK